MKLIIYRKMTLKPDQNNTKKENNCYTRIKWKLKMNKIYTKEFLILAYLQCHAIWSFIVRYFCRNIFLNSFFLTERKFLLKISKSQLEFFSLNLLLFSILIKIIWVYYIASLFRLRLRFNTVDIYLIFRLDCAKVRLVDNFIVAFDGIYINLFLLSWKGYKYLD